MKNIKPRVKYQGISLPLPLINEIKIHISKDPTYQTVPSYVRDAVREKFNRDKQLKEYIRELEDIKERINRLENG